MANIDTMRRQLRTMGARVRLGRRGRHLRPRLLPLEPVAVPAVPGGGPRLSRRVGGRLVPQRRHARARAGRGRRPPLLAVRRQGREARAGAVVPADHQLRRRAARLRAASTGRSRSGSCRRTGSAAPAARRSCSRPRPRRITRAARSCACSRPGPTRCSAPRSWCWRRSTRWSRTLTAPDERAEVEAYVARRPRSRPRSTACRPSARRPASPIGADAINPVNGARIPIFVADYVLGGYGTGAIMAVPAHDERDFEFAKAFGLPIVRVDHAQGRRVTEASYERRQARVHRSTAGRRGHRSTPGRSIGRGTAARGMARDRRARSRSRARAATAVTYRLRDWLVSRQRYWGTPIPVIHCERCGIVPVPDDELPVLLPDTVDYRGSGENPLTRDEAFLNVACPSCGGPAKRETDTLDTFIDSSWYWFRYLSPHKDDGPVDPDLVESWTPVEQYTGGAEHAVMHLLYSRFLTKAMRDVGLVQRERAVPAAVQPGPDPGRRRRADEQEPGQRPGPGRAGRPLRRGHGPAVPDVHGPLGPGRPVEPDRHQRA